MATTRIRVKQILQSPLPPLNQGSSKTSSSALHRLRYVGSLGPWPNFQNQVEAAYNAQAFSRSTTSPVSPGPHQVDPDIVSVGDEHGLQGRFQQAIGQVLGVALEAQGINLSFGDFKCSGIIYENIPDVIGLSRTIQGNDELSLIGELKVPWVLAHSISDAYHTPKGLRRLLGQPLLYMRDLGSAYGFLSTYEETIFLYQTQLANGQWHVEYSPVVWSTDIYEPSQGPSSIPSLSMRQCMFYVAGLASQHGPVSNQTPASQWVVWG